MKKLTLYYQGTDWWSRPVYKDQNGNLLKDINCGDEPIQLCTVCGGFDGEPIGLIDIKATEIIIKGKGNVPTATEKFNYMMLSRMERDCKYYLGNGNHNPKCLWANDEKKQIKEMKKIYNDLKIKPEWLTMEDIEKLESEMI